MRGVGRAAWLCPLIGTVCARPPGVHCEFAPQARPPACGGDTTSVKYRYELMNDGEPDPEPAPGTAQASSTCVNMPKMYGSISGGMP